MAIVIGYVVPVVHVLACVFLIVVVLLQTGKGADMGAVFGGGSQTLFGSSGAGNFLTKLTTGTAILDRTVVHVPDLFWIHWKHLSGSWFPELYDNGTVKPPVSYLEKLLSASTRLLRLIGLLPIFLIASTNSLAAIQSPSVYTSSAGTWLG